MTAAETSWPWQRLNQGNLSSHEVLATLLEPRSGERWLDVGTGAGGLALQLARRGADVTGVDVAPDGLEHARRAAAEEGLTATFELADAQELPFEDAAFDGVASAFGVVFAADHDRAARELARVCRTGGKLGLTLMPMDSRTGAAFATLERYGGRSPHPASFAEQVDGLLGATFELEIARRESPEPRRPPLSWEEALRTLAPLRAVVERLDEPDTAALRQELEEIEQRYASTAPSYVLVLGRRR